MGKFGLRLLVFALAGSCMAVANAGFVSYREIFCHSGTDSPTFQNGQPANGGTTANIEWYLRRPNLVGQIVNSPSTQTQVNTVAAGTGITTNLPAIHAGPQQSAQTAKGFAVIPAASAPIADAVPNGSSYILYTREYAAALAGVESFQWYQGNHSATDSWRVAIEIDGGSWYVSDASFTNASITSGSAFPTAGEFKQLSMAGAQWRNLDFNGSLAASSGSMSMGALTSLSGSTITGFGLYTASKTNNMRFDTFEVTAVPEPSSFGLIALGIVGVFSAKRKRNPLSVTSRF